MEFCSNCGTRLVYKSRDKSALYCSKCRKKSESSGEKLRKGSFSKPSQSRSDCADGIVVLDRKVLKLRTRPRVDSDCVKCNGKKAETWTLDLGSEDHSQAIFFRCVSCGHTWRETE